MLGECWGSVGKSGFAVRNGRSRRADDRQEVATLSFVHNKIILLLRRRTVKPTASLAGSLPQSRILRYRMWVLLDRRGIMVGTVRPGRRSRRG